jgi:hypothetical protein
VVARSHPDNLSRATHRLAHTPGRRCCRGPR